MDVNLITNLIFIGELNKKIFEVFSEKNKYIKLEDLKFMNLRFLHLEEEFQKTKV